MRRILICGFLQAIAFAQPAGNQILGPSVSDSCLVELFSAETGKSNLFARAYNKWAVYIKETVAGPSPAAQARYREDLWKLTKNMENALDRLQASRCYPAAR